MADSVLKRMLKIAVAKATEWGTAEAVGAGDGLRALTISGMDRQINIAPDHSAGQQFEGFAHVGIDVTPNPAYTVLINENDDVAMLALAAILGDDVVSGGSDPYTHTMPFEDEGAVFLSLYRQEGDEVKACASFKPTSVEQSFDGNGILQFSVSGIGNKITTAAADACDTVTFPTRSTAYTMDDTVFRINAQAGDALDADDAVEVADLVVTFGRESDTVLVTGGDAIVEPKDGAYPTCMMTFRIPRKNAMSKTLYTGMGAGTMFKGDITISGSSASRELLEQFPQLQVESCSNPDNDVIYTEVTLRGQKASAAPTGMTATKPTVAWKCGVSGALV